MGCQKCRNHFCLGVLQIIRATVREGSTIFQVKPDSMFLKISVFIGGWGSEKCQKCVTYYLNRSLHFVTEKTARWTK